MVQAVERGENPLDCWSGEWSLGYPVLRTYQPLAHALVALVYFALGKSVGLMTVFVWVRFLSVVLLPLSFFLAARLMGLGPLDGRGRIDAGAADLDQFSLWAGVRQLHVGGQRAVSASGGQSLAVDHAGAGGGRDPARQTRSADRRIARVDVSRAPDLRVHGRAIGVPAGGDSGCAGRACGTGAAGGGGGSGGASDLGLSTRAAVDGREQHQSQPLGAGGGNGIRSARSRS